MTSKAVEPKSAYNSAHCGPQNENLGANLKNLNFSPTEVIQYPKKTLPGRNWSSGSNGNILRCLAVTVLEKKGDLVWYSAHSALQIAKSGTKLKKSRILNLKKNPDLYQFHSLQFLIYFFKKVFSRFNFQKKFFAKIFLAKIFSH